MAISVLADVDQLEERLFALLEDDEKLASLPTIAWDEVGTKIFAPRWETLAREHARAFAGLTINTVPNVVRYPHDFAQKLKISMTYRDRMVQQVTEAVGTIIAAALVRQGWTPEIVPGRPIRCRRGKVAIDSITVVGRLISDDLSAELWRQQFASQGLSELALAPSRLGGAISSSRRGVSPVSRALQVATFFSSRMAVLIRLSVLASDRASTRF